jgi:cellulose synthase/poly-beta-1,6-N-acetylglucosamine synthase-like glycosyltransferase/peptidoglycan/xylan/chitin deacetylase (PgdA/CDA1 family)/spore germination protein YaaH
VARSAAIASSLLAAALVLGLLTPPLLPRIAISNGGSAQTPQFAGTRLSRQRLAARRQLFAALAGRPAAPALHRSALPAPPALTQPTAPIAGRALAAGFYVNWDDNSFVSLKAHASRLDWVICEWGFLTPNGQSVDLRVDRRVLYLMHQFTPLTRPSVMLMLSNYDSAKQTFDGARLRGLVKSRAARAAVISRLQTVVSTYGLGGVNVDFEEIPDDLEPFVRTFVGELGVALHSIRTQVSQSIAAETEPANMRADAAVNDRVILMLYDEHSGPHDAGPVASQAWYDKQARRAAQVIPANKLILAVGGYGYDWNDGSPNEGGYEQTFQDVMRLAQQHNARVMFDSVSLNPYLTFSDPDSTDHVIWFLDGVTGYNELRTARAIGAAGSAVWRLGSEDPSIWSVLGRTDSLPVPDTLRSLTAAYDVDFRGTGELLRIDSRPVHGLRELFAPESAAITNERILREPLPYIVARTGNKPGRVALTFDDGPDTKWTPMILDTLRSRKAPATFFVIGENVESNINLTRRIAREGHEIGNHTFTHPNLALTPAFVTRLELDATERIIEAVLNRRSAFFRPPYFGDAEPTTADELVPVSIATSLGYVTAGLHVDSEDWLKPDAQTIVSNVLVARHKAITCTDSLHASQEERKLEQGCSGSVVLLHDGGGDRTNTVAAVGALIDSLRAEGDTLVLLSSLAGITHEQAMPPLPTSSAAVRYGDLLAFGALGTTEWVLYWLFLIAVVLGAARLFIILVLAAIQRVKSHRARKERPAYTPSVSVVVPAFREERVIVKTIESLLAQEYAGELQVVVVDDGSPDATYERASEAFRDNPNVAVYRKENGGKASALNYGLAYATGEIIVGLDADTVFRPDTVARLVLPLADPCVGAVAGNAKVGNRLNIVTRWQAVEYVTSQNLDRRAFSLLDCITVVPGAVGAWRKSVVDDIGGFNDATLAEDQDLTLSVRRHGYRIAYADDAIAYTEAPDTLKGLANQRFRWSFGTLQCMWKHRAAFLRSGTLGWVAMPNVWLFQLLFPAVSPIADLMFLWSLFSVWLASREHGSTYALLDLRSIMTFYGIFLLVDWTAAVIAFLMEPDEDKRLTWLVFLQRFVYRQVMYLVVVRSFRAAIRGRVVGWGKLERKATVGVGVDASGLGASDAM